MPGFVLLQAVSGGGYLSGGKAVPLVLLLLLWTRLLTWTDKDAVAAHLPRVPLNFGNLLGLIVGYFLFFFLPVGFFVAFLAPVFLFLVEIGVYLALRKKQVGLGDLQDQFVAWLKSFKKEKDDGNSVWQVQLLPKSGPAYAPPAKEDPNRPAFEAAQFALTDPLKKNADQFDLTPSSAGVAVKYTVDGVGYDGPALDGTSGPAAITLFKRLAGLDVDERRKPQTGAMKFVYNGQKKELKLQTAGNTAGEYVRMLVDPGKRHSHKMEGMGFTESQLATIRESMKEGGVVLLAAPKAQGLTSLSYGILRAHDAYLQHIQSIERDAEQDLEGITQNKLAANATGAEEAKQADWVTSQQPNVVLVDKIEDRKTAEHLVKYAADGGKVYLGFRAGSAVEAIEQWRKVAGDDDTALSQLKLVIVGRVLRKLCEACKESYSPDPNTLRKLNLNPDKVSTLYKAREQPLRDPKGNPIPCTFCHDLRFLGRTGVFELVLVTDEIREALKRDLATGRVGSQFKAAFRKQRGRYLQEEALGLVEEGVTSVQEVLRVLRGPDEAPARSSSSSAPAAAAPRALSTRRAPAAGRGSGPAA